MTDFDQRLGEMLTDVADHAPAAAGLAAAARRRRHARRRRRTLAGALVASLVVIAGTFSVVGGVGGGADDLAKDPGVPAPPGGWRRVEARSAAAAVPPGWTEHSCPAAGSLTVHGPPDACDGPNRASFHRAATFDAIAGPGVVENSDDGTSWHGYVHAGGDVLSASADDRALLRRILATAHAEGQPRVDASRWTSFVEDGIAYEVPRRWGLTGDADLSGYSVCARIAAKRVRPPSGVQRDDEHYALTADLNGLDVTVTAPTRAVAELVLATVKVSSLAVAPEDCLPVDFGEAAASESAGRRAQ